MRIKTRLQILSISLVIFFTVGLLSLLVALVQTKFYSIEQSLARRDILRVIDSLAFDQEALEVTVKDYAFWDDTYEFMEGKNPEFPGNNFSETSMKNLGVDFIAMYDPSGSLKYSLMHIPGAGLTSGSPCPEDVDACLCMKGIVENSSGVIRVDNTAYMASSSRIFRSDASGDSAGWLIMGTEIGESKVQSLRQRSSVYVDLVMTGPFLGESLDFSKYNRKAGLLEGREDYWIEGSIDYYTENGGYVFSLFTRTQRILRIQTSEIMQNVVLMACLFAFFFIFLITHAFYYWIARPLGLIGNAVKKIEEENSLDGENSDYSGLEDDLEIDDVQNAKDEIGEIASAVKLMHERVIAAHKAVISAKNDLEKEVLERTSDLVKINGKLELFEKLLANTIEAVIITDLSGKIIDLNDAMCIMTGYRRDEILGKNSRIFKSDHHSPEFYQSMWESLLSSGCWEGEVWDRKKDGTVFPKWQTINTIYDEKRIPVNYVGISTDISVIKEAEAKLNRLAYYDPLTALPNRMLFADRLEHEIAVSKRNITCFAVLFVDLDRFKNVNDSMGHLAGDSLLVKVAERLREAIRDSDTLCRIGGDEFAIILQNLAAEENAGKIAGAIVQKLSACFEVMETEVYIGASVGIALYPKDGTDPETLLRKADGAMYLAKDAGKGLYRYASGEMELANKSRLEIEAKMHQALANNEFVLFYQPQTKTSEAIPGSPFGLVGVEALIRWIPEPNLIIPPGDFLPVAEESGFISPLGDWVLLQSCKDAKKWLDMGFPVQVSVNVAARQFDQGNFTERVRSTLATTGLPAELLKLEVTESGCMRNISHVTEIMRRIRELGVTFAIDDFGTGYCSLQYLHRLPVDCLKIDQSFVRSMDKKGNGADIVSAVISMARAFGLASIAEGVETFDQLEMLQTRGCEQIQGFLVSRPMHFEAFVKFLTAQKELCVQID